MTAWARLTWQVPDPATHAGQLRRGLGIAGRPGGLVPGAIVLDLETAALEVRPWIREGPRDEPSPGGRLVLEPVPGGEEPVAGTVAALPAAAGERGHEAPLILAGLGWATVELERAETELGPWLAVPDPGDPGGAVDGEDRYLGARARVRRSSGLPGTHLVLLEPATEGRLAASLARDGEGPCAIYLAPRDPGGLPGGLEGAAERGLHVGRPLHGPLGPARLVTLGGQRAPGPAAMAGPHILILEPPAAGAGPPAGGPGRGAPGGGGAPGGSPPSTIRA